MGFSLCPLLILSLNVFMPSNNDVTNDADTEEVIRIPPKKNVQEVQSEYHQQNSISVGLIDKISCSQKFKDCHCRSPKACFPKFQSFTQALSDTNRSSMKGSSWMEGCPTSLDTIQSIRFLHWNEKEEVVWGEIRVHTDIAKEVEEIFEELYIGLYPIHQVRPPEEYGVGTLDNYEANNSFAFHCS
ncbi:MAG: hypothetical protein VX278_03580, partial [Myxococcota bacterium]|nr:hypothetical protein [Myxococcota bacterium]